MAIANSDVTVTSTWTQVSSATTGSFVLYNEAQPQGNPAPLGQPGSTAIRIAFAASTPSVRGMALYAGDYFSRGSVEGHVWVKTDVDGANIPAQKAE
jgi:hypothetical protein